MRHPLSRQIYADIPAVTFDVPADADVLTVPHHTPPLTDPAAAIAQALAEPIGTPPLADIVATAAPGKSPAEKTAVIVVSDITRPDVPYKGEASILHPVLRTLAAQGLRPEHMMILVATGTHRPNTPEENLHTFGADVVQHYPIVNHCATDATHCAG